jgi:hypothetical protein
MFSRTRVKEHSRISRQRISFDRKWLVNDPLRHPSGPNDIAEWLELWVTSNETDHSDG